MPVRRKFGTKGGNLGRSAIVTIRFTEKVRFAAELVSRFRHQTVSAYIENTIRRDTAEAPVESDVAPVTAAVAADRVWDDDEDVRINNLVREFPDLLSPWERTYRSFYAINDPLG